MDTLIEQNKELNKEVRSGMITSVWQRQKLSQLTAKLKPRADVWMRLPPAVYWHMQFLTPPFLT